MDGKLVVIEDSIITALLSNQAATAALPALKNSAGLAGSAETGCGGCKAKARVKSINYGQVRIAISNMRGRDLTILKGLLGAKRIRVRYRATSNKDVVLTM